ncbi:MULTISPECIES: hypothetical protein [Cupriavidus]|uniref:hypothetical protein n=1 Tax=Cupriavidus TaxID=106589 RepID=UPI000E19EAB1|nr:MULTISPECIES: hypothetical protein [Cupriavidus]MEC3764489.1 hypothetical protein [Cupriavidus sp. SS-3]SOY92801.1 conserved hypothetical protein [Cupriavidus taiwanensis]SOY97011.1 conserved hypothetical protein [Cupriavidus taiwanensis]SPA32640.1 conserved hypothetical protein [Cupriavidus taiwanensis]
MDFKTVTEQFASSVPGTDAFLKVKEQSLALMSADPDHAAAYFLVYGFARSYVILHDDEGITTDVANAAQAQLLGYMRSIEQSLSGGEQELLGAMNRIVLDYDGRRQLF